jgi:hypothetical protein
MGKVCSILLFFQLSYTFIFSDLDSKYIVSYGNPDSKIKIREYFSLSCRTCLELFKKDFSNIKSKYLDSEEVSWEYSIVPMDLTSLQAMVCLSALDNVEKQIFFESISQELPDTSLENAAPLMMHAMSLLGKPIPDLESNSFIEQTEAFEDAFTYVKSNDMVNELPTLSINGRKFKELPSFSFISEKVDSLLTNYRRG